MTPVPSPSPDTSRGARPSPALLVVLVAAIALGIALRCDGLARKAAWYDEVGTMLRLSGHTEGEVAAFAEERPRAPAELLLRFQRVPRGALANDTAAVVRAVTEDESLHSPGYFVAASLWARVAGDDPPTLRGLSAATSIAALVLLGVLARRLFGDPQIALATVALAAVSPVQIRYAQEARAYALWSVTLLATLLATHAASTRRSAARGGAPARDAWGTLIVAFAAALYVHPLSLLVLPALLVLARDARPGSRVERSPVPPCARALAAAIVLWLPWALVVLANRQQAARTAGWMGDAFPLLDLVRAWLGVATSILYRPAGPGGLLDGVTLPGTTLAWLALGVSACTLIVVALLRVARAAPRAARRSVPALALVPFACLALADVALGGRRSTVDRYLLPAWLAVELAIAFLLVAPGPRARLRRATLLVVLALGMATAIRTRPLHAWWNTEPERLAELRALETSLRGRDAPIVVTDVRPLRLLELAWHLPAHATIRAGSDAVPGLDTSEWPRVVLVSPSPELLARARAAAAAADTPLERDVVPFAWRVRGAS